MAAHRSHPKGDTTHRKTGKCRHRILNQTLSDAELEEHNRFKRLRGAIADLQGAKPHEPDELAERLLDVYHQARS